jgi:hypothetical protein
MKRQAVLSGWRIRLRVGWKACTGTGLPRPPMRNDGVAAAAAVRVRPALIISTID